MPLTQADLKRQQDIIDDLQFVNEVAEMVIKGKDKYIKALEEEVIILRMIASN